MRFKILISLFLAVTCVFFASCKSAEESEKSNHVHSFVQQKIDDKYHWRECRCGEIREKEEHKYYEYVCSCGLQSYSPELSFVKSADGLSYSVSSCEKTAEIAFIPTFYDSLPVTKILDGAFEGISSLKKVALSNGVEEICDRAFFGCENLEKLQLPESLLKIGESAFENCSSLKKINLPKSVTEVEKRAFANCKSVTKVEIHKNLEILGELAFIGCSSLIEFAVDGRNDNFKSKSGNLYTKDGKGLICFANGKTKLTFSVPSSVEKIYDYAFYGNENLTTLYLERNLKAVGYKALYIKNLQTINYTGEKQNFEQIEFDDEWLSSEKTVTVYPNGESFTLNV